MRSSPRVLVWELWLGLADTDIFFYDDKLEKFSKNIIEELGLNAFQVDVLLRNRPKKYVTLDWEECFSSIRVVNGINVNFHLLYLFFVVITSNYQSFCTVFVNLPLWEMHCFHSWVELGWSMTQSLCSPLLPAHNLPHATYGCCLRPSEVGFETFSFLA